MAIPSLRPFLLPVGPIGDRAPVKPEVPARIPTGIPDFDYLTGGLPTGSVVLLYGEAGAGHQEFALTSAVHLMLHYDDPRSHQFYLGRAKGPFSYPDGLAYVSLTRSREQVLKEVRSAFEGSYPEVLARHLKFADLSPTYFADSAVPSSWSSVANPLLSSTSAGLSVARDGPLRSLAEAVEAAGMRNLVIVDSVTDLVARRGIEPEELITLIKGLRRRAKDWDGIVYLLLSKGVASPATEQGLIDSVDGALQFGWTNSSLHSFRQRTMLIEKFMPVLAHVPHEHQGRFVIRIGALTGLVTTQYERL